MALRALNMKKDVFIIKNLISKDFKVKYRRSVLGVLWSVLNPLLMMIVLAAVFTHVFKFAIENFPVYLILGLTLFNLMANSTSAGVQAITGAAGLIKKVRVNKLVFPIESVLFEMVNYAFSLVAVVAVMAFFRIAPSWDILFLPLLLIYVLIFCTGLCFLLSALTVFFRDVIHLWGVVIIAWTYATPLFYPATALPDLMQTLILFNPMYQYVNYLRDIAMWGINPGFVANIMCFGMAAVTFMVGLVVFRMTERRFILHV
ncbi:MAG: ABC transporter permease [Coriobacteriia bacterium]|nr:ABC transporter permease [Coriobacteriia bacterium]